jgi:hypothetical protein
VQQLLACIRHETVQRLCGVRPFTFVTDVTVAARWTTKDVEQGCTPWRGEAAVGELGKPATLRLLADKLKRATDTSARAAEEKMVIEEEMVSTLMWCEARLNALKSATHERDMELLAHGITTEDVRYKRGLLLIYETESQRVLRIQQAANHLFGDTGEAPEMDDLRGGGVDDDEDEAGEDEDGAGDDVDEDDVASDAGEDAERMWREQDW